MAESKYDVHTSTGSKGAVFTFMATFIACLLLLDNTAGLFTGTVFLIVGMFTASVALAMPFYFYKKKHPETYSIVSMIEFLATTFLTVIFFLYFFTNPLGSATSTTTISSDNDSAYIVRCDEPIPEFSWGMDSLPSKAEVDAVCLCIWKDLSPSHKNLSASLARNKSHDASEAQLKIFIYTLGVATKSCSTKGL